MNSFLILNHLELLEITENHSETLKLSIKKSGCNMWDMIQQIFLILTVISTVVSIITIFRQPRDIAATWAWLLVLILFPVFGLVLYFFFGRKMTKTRIFDMRSQKALGMEELVDVQQALLTDDRALDQFNGNIYLQDLATLFLQSDESILTEHNKIKFFYDGKTKFQALKEDLKQAKDHIHMLYYIFRDDSLGEDILSILTERAKAGVEVLVLYDAWGSAKTKDKSFDELHKAGGRSIAFFGSKIPLINFHLNHRNHRKIVVIDGKIGYVGGFNVGNEYLGKGKLGYWRDTHLRIEGNSVLSLQSRFFIDWNAVASHQDKRDYQKRYFPIAKPIGNSTMQIVTSGPESEKQQIKMGLIKMIAMARKYIYIQTPYFIPDESLLEALRIAIYSGIDVRIMIPCKPDHPIVYRATEYYAKLIEETGATIYIYTHGFLHSKMMVVDGEIATVGTSNFDVRSFKLNFEVNTFIYDLKVTKELANVFIRDSRYCRIADHYYFKQQSHWRKFKQNFSRLFSPIL